MCSLCVRSLHSSVIVTERRDTTLSADHFAYDALAIPVIYLFFPPFEYSRLFARTSRSCSLREISKSGLEAGIVHALPSDGECLVWALQRPMQRARASRVTVTNENTHSLVSRTRGTRHCAFFASLLPALLSFRRVSQSMRPYAAKSKIPRMSRRRDFVTRCQDNRSYVATRFPRRQRTLSPLA